MVKQYVFYATDVKVGLNYVCALNVTFQRLKVLFCHLICHLYSKCNKSRLISTQ